MLQDPASIALGAVCAYGAVLISIYQILCHLRNYTEPVFQRYIIRIIFMVPVYAVASWCSLKWREAAIYFDTIRDCYEAWIIYNFKSLLLAYVGGPGAVVVQAEGKVVHPSWPHLTCCLPTMQVDGFFLRRCKQGTLQFVLLKPVMAALTLILYAAGDYRDGDMSPTDGYFYISIMYNVCYTLALYGLMLFWIGAAELLQPFNPLLKFILVKTVVFLTFWQGIAISMINSMGKISDPEDGKALQNFMICVEMLLASISMLYAFPVKEYQIGGSAAGFRADAFTHAISIKDVIKDTIHVFAPSYSDYVLYSDGGPADNVKRKKYRGQKGKMKTKGMQGGLEIAAAGGGGGGGGSRGPSRLGMAPEPNAKAFEATRNMAILIDSDSDGMESDDEGPQLGTVVQSDSDGEGGETPMKRLAVAKPTTKMPTALLSDSDDEEAGYGSRPATALDRSDDEGEERQPVRPGRAASKGLEDPEKQQQRTREEAPSPPPPAAPAAAAGEAKKGSTRRSAMGAAADLAAAAAAVKSMGAGAGARAPSPLAAPPLAAIALRPPAAIAQAVAAVAAAVQRPGAAGSNQQQRAGRPPAAQAAEEGWAEKSGWGDQPEGSPTKGWADSKDAWEGEQGWSNVGLND